MSVLPEEPYDAGGGRVFDRRYTVEHLEWQNLARRRTDVELSVMLREIAGFASPEPLEAALFSSLADYLDGTGNLPAKADLAGVVMIGNFRGLGAQNGVSMDADILWAGVARMLRRAGVEHVNDLGSE